MNLTLPKSSLLRLLSICNGIASKKSVMPVLANVLLTADPATGLEASATNLDLSFNGATRATVKAAGSIAVGCRDLLERVKVMPDGDVTLSVDKGAVKLSAGSRRFTLQAMDAGEYPALPEQPESATSRTFSVADLLTLIAKVEPSVSRDETRIHLNSACIEANVGKLRMISTDGHRLSVAALDFGGEGFSPILLPLGGLVELRRLLDGTDETEVALAWTGAVLFCSIGDDVYTAKLADAAFPPWEQVIPESSERRITLARAALADAVKAVAVAASERTGGVKLTLGRGKLRVESESPESGEGFDELTIDYDGAEVSIGCNARYLLEALAAASDEGLALELSGELDPILVKQPDGDGVLVVLMPMRV
jgi:DNA polymerase-3 subunit beta